jgi:hypothetical protein
MAFLFASHNSTCISQPSWCMCSNLVKEVKFFEANSASTIFGSFYTDYIISPFAKKKIHSFQQSTFMIPFLHFSLTRFHLLYSTFLTSQLNVSNIRYELDLCFTTDIYFQLLMLTIVIFSCFSVWNFVSRFKETRQIMWRSLLYMESLIF